MSEQKGCMSRLALAVFRGFVTTWVAGMLLRLPFALLTPLTDNYPPLEPELRPYAYAMNAGILFSALLLGIVAGVRSFRGSPETTIEANSCKCGYSLTGNVSGVCPECGTAIGAAGVLDCRDVRIPRRLLRLLRSASREMLAYGDAPYIGHYDNCRQLGEFIARSGAELAGGDLRSLPELWGIFAPTSDWDDAGGSQRTANACFGILNTMTQGKSRAARNVQFRA